MSSHLACIENSYALYYLVLACDPCYSDQTRRPLVAAGSNALVAYASTLRPKPESIVNALVSGKKGI